MGETENRSMIRFFFLVKKTVKYLMNSMLRILAHLCRACHILFNTAG